MDNIFFNIKQSFLIIYRNRRLIYLSLLVLIFVLNFSFYNIVNISNVSNVFSSKFSSNFNGKSSQPNFLRFLNQISQGNKVRH